MVQITVPPTPDLDFDNLLKRLESETDPEGVQQKDITNLLSFVAGQTDLEGESNPQTKVPYINDKPIRVDRERNPTTRKWQLNFESDDVQFTANFETVTDWLRVLATLASTLRGKGAQYFVFIRNALVNGSPDPEKVKFLRNDYEVAEYMFSNTDCIRVNDVLVLAGVLIGGAKELWSDEKIRALALTQWTAAMELERQ